MNKKNSLNYDRDVLIVGAGPVGLMTAILLQRENIKHRVIEKRSHRQSFSKAFAIHSRSLEIFEDIGVFDQVMRKCFPVEVMNIYSNGKKLINYNFNVLDIPHQCVASIPQNEIEDILMREYSRLGGIIDRGVELVDIVHTSFGVIAHKVAESDCHSPQVDGAHAYRYLLACDGSNSQVRNILNVPFDGYKYPTPYIIADGILKWDGDSSAGNVFVADGGYVMFFPLPEGRCRVVVNEHTGLLNSEDLTEELVNMYIRGKGITSATFSDSVWLTVARFNRKLVDRYRHGNVFLAGDACHVHSPFGGQGLNTGLQDAYNLAWKISHKLKFNTSESLLDSYNEERRPVAEMVLNKTDQQMKLLSVKNPVIKFVRDVVVSRLSQTAKFQRKVVGQAGGFMIDYRNSNIVPSVDDEISGRRMVDHILRKIMKRAELDDDIQLHTEKTRIFDLLKGCHYSVFVIGDEALSCVANKITNVFYNRQDFCRFFGVVDSYTLDSFTDKTLSFFSDVMFDERGAFKEKHSLKSGTIILVRPDGYVALCCDIDSIHHLNRYMSDIYGDFPNQHEDGLLGGGGELERTNETIREGGSAVEVA